jgi:uncharacterized membrane protein YeaQ/YmgE (transglycosylase-associated protein family)
MGCLVSIILGGFIGWLAGVITKSHMGILWTIIVGMVGSSLGHYVAEGIGLAAYGPVARLAVSVGGAVLLIWICRFLGIM